MNGQRLFGTWIAQTKELQESHYNMKFDNMSQDELERWFLVNAYSAAEEIHEAGGEVSWKPWAKSEFFHREAFLGEIVDALHFIGNLLAGAQVTDEELNEAYLEKMQRNRERQESGYTGLDKCPECKRAIDDILAHGGNMIVRDGVSTCDACVYGGRNR